MTRGSTPIGCKKTARLKKLWLQIAFSCLYGLSPSPLADVAVLIDLSLPAYRIFPYCIMPNFSSQYGVH